MNYLLGFKLFERKKDISFILNIEDLYKKMILLIENEIEENNIYAVGYDKSSKYIYLNNFIVPIFIFFEKEAETLSFGEVIVDGDKSPCLIIPFINNSYMKSINSNIEYLKHEIVHLVDYLKYGGFKSIPDGSKIRKEWKESEIEKYFNHPYERNAYFIQGACHIYRMLKTDSSLLNNFKRFLIHMKIGSSEDYFNNLTEKNKKKYISRAYMLFNALKKENSLI